MPKQVVCNPRRDTLIKWVMERLVNLIGPIQQLRKEQREVVNSALRAASIAINETYLYYRSLEKGRAKTGVRVKFKSICPFRAGVIVNRNGIKMQKENKSHSDPDLFEFFINILIPPGQI